MRGGKIPRAALIALALGSLALLVACGGAPATPTPRPPTPTSIATPTLSATEHLDLGITYQEQGKLDEAIAEFKEAIRLDPELAEAHGLLGSAYLKQGKLDEAIAELEEAIRLNPDYAEAHFVLGSAYLKQGKLDKAIAECKEAIRLNPDSAEAHYGLGGVYYAQGKLDEAIAELKEAIRLNPDYADAHYGLGVAYLDQDKLDEAIAELEEAIRINPDYADAHSLLGGAYYAQGKLDEAIAEFEEAIRINPELVKVHYYLGVVYAELGQTEKAIAALETYLSLRPDAPNRAEVEGRITQLKARTGGLTVEYRNPLGGYSVRYPEGWSYKEIKANVTFVKGEEVPELVTDVPVIVFAADTLTSTVKVAKELGLEGITDLGEYLKALALALGMQAGEAEYLEIAGYPAAMVELPYAFTDKGKTYKGSHAIVLLEERSIYAIATAPSDEWDALRPIFKGMFRSLSFFEPE